MPSLNRSSSRRLRKDEDQDAKQIETLAIDEDSSIISTPSTQLLAALPQKTRRGRKPKKAIVTSDNEKDKEEEEEKDQIDKEKKLKPEKFESERLEEKMPGTGGNWNVILSTLPLLFFGYVFLFASNFFMIFYLYVTYLAYLTYRWWCHRKTRKSSLLSVLASVLTLILTAAVLHSALRISFDSYEDLEYTRLGLITTNSAVLFIRYPPVSTVTADSSYYIRAHYRKVGMNEWKLGPYAKLTIEKDWAANVTLEDLSVNSEYEYTWIYVDKGALNIARFSSTGRRSTPITEIIYNYVFLKENFVQSTSRFHFRTLPKSLSKTSMRLAFGSCLKAFFPYGSSLPGVGLIAKHKPDIFLSLGDFIYADAGIQRDKSEGFFRRLYREVIAQPEMISLFQNSTILGTPDDHEIVNNWDGAQDKDIYQSAMSAFKIFLGDYSHTTDGGLYYSFEYGNIAFFVLDSRCCRIVRDSNGNDLPSSSAERTMLGKTQKKALLKWLDTVKTSHPFKIIATSIPFTFNFANSDTWTGFQLERTDILDHIIDNDIKGVLFLSGDRHQIASVEFLHEKSDQNPVYEYSVSPINQFNPQVPFFFQAHNAPGLWKETEEQKLVSSSMWKLDKTLFYTPYGGRFVFGRLDIDTTGTLAKKAKCNSSNAAVLCVFGIEKGDEKNEDGLCEGEGRLIYHHVVCA